MSQEKKRMIGISILSATMSGLIIFLSTVIYSAGCKATETDLKIQFLNNHVIKLEQNTTENFKNVKSDFQDIKNHLEQIEKKL